MHDNKAITLIAFVCQIIMEIEIFRRESRKTITSKASPRLAFYYAGHFLYGMYELTKPRLSILSVFTASSATGKGTFTIRFIDILSLTIGTALAAGGAAALNQWMERSEDASNGKDSFPPNPSRLDFPRICHHIWNCSLFSRHLCAMGWNKPLGSHPHSVNSCNLLTIIHTDEKA